VTRLRHWHPVARASDASRGPSAFRLDGRDFVVFRTAQGAWGATPRACPHRRGDLARGRVQGDSLACPYHGWAVSPDGRVTSPANPGLEYSVSCLAVAERYGVLWVRERDGTGELPTLDFAGYGSASTLRHRVRAPLQIVLDNFVEVEHTSFVHAFLGYTRESLPDVSVSMETTESSVRVINEGPQKPLPSPIRAIMGIGEDDVFVDDWTTWFSPVYSVYEHYWRSPGGERRENALRTAVFFNYVDEDTTELWSFTAASSPLLRLPIVKHFMRSLVRFFVELEVRLDRRLVESLFDKDPGMRGMKLGRFDKVMWETRRRVASIYEGRAD
jgi:phenylpropionate dioxygenase-like ring-hydroxylating dioxygenase large terminal subunit